MRAFLVNVVRWWLAGPLLAVNAVCVWLVSFIVAEELLWWIQVQSLLAWHHAETLEWSIAGMRFELGPRDADIASLGALASWLLGVQRLLLVLIGALGMLVAIRACVRWLEPRLTTGPGLCASCGYDLRGTAPEAPCPECGAGAHLAEPGCLQPGLRRRRKFEGEGRKHRARTARTRPPAPGSGNIPGVWLRSLAR